MNKPNFKERKKAREYALQALYSWQLSRNNIKDVEAHHLAEHAKAKFDTEYFKELLHAIPADVSAIDSLIAPHLSRTMDELTPIELALLRMATYEFKARLEIPYRVIINEAVDLSKAYGAAEGHKFVNGVLDKLAKQLRAEEIKG